MKRAIDETNRRRKIQSDYNKKYGIVPKSVKKDIRELLNTVDTAEKDAVSVKDKPVTTEEKIAEYTKLMKEAAKAMEYEIAAYYRDEIIKLKGEL